MDKPQFPRENPPTATIEDTTIIQLWGDSRGFERRAREYAERCGARVGFVVPLSRLDRLDDEINRPM